MAVLAGAGNLAADDRSRGSQSTDTAMTKKVVATLPYQELNNNTCNTNICRIAFGKVNATGRLYIDSVSCGVRVNGGGEIAYAGLQTDRGDADLFVPRLNLADGSFKWYAFSHRTNVIVRPKTEMWIELRADAADTVANATCAVAGRLAQLK